MAGADIEAVLVDVGGTLWPNTWPLTPTLRRARLHAVATALGTEPAAAADALAGIVALIDEGVAAVGGESGEPADVVIARVLAEHGYPTDHGAVRSVRQSLCLNLGEHVKPFDGAGDLLRGIKDLGLRCVILSNTTFRDAEMYGRDFDALGWTPWIDGCITSVDAGCAKPDARIFGAALDAAGSAAERTAMIGNSEHADIAPGAALGMRTILVAIEDPPPTTRTGTRADRWVTTLDAALEALEVLVRR